jgi:hypothetical protein
MRRTQCRAFTGMRRRCSQVRGRKESGSWARLRTRALFAQRRARFDRRHRDQTLLGWLDSLLLACDFHAFARQLAGRLDLAGDRRFTCCLAKRRLLE